MAGNQGRNRIVWQDWQIDFIKANFASMTAQQLAGALGLKRTVVRNKYYELGLKKMEMEYWTPDQVAYLLNVWQHMGDVEIASYMQEKWPKRKGWTKQHIDKKRIQMGLSRTRQMTNNIRQRNRSLGCFARGNVKMWQTRGVANFGGVRIWNISGRDVKVIKVGTEFVHYAHWLYEYIYGPIPSGCVVRLKDGDPLNVTASNLILVTRRQHAKLNSQNRNPQLTQSRLLISKIKKIAKRYEKQTNGPE